MGFENSMPWKSNAKVMHQANYSIDDHYEFIDIIRIKQCLKDVEEILEFN